MSAEQSQLLALQKARAAAIERAAGVKVASATLVRGGAVADDLIRTYARGDVIAERVEWLPLARYQDSPGRAPIPEYRVRVVADVAVPDRRQFRGRERPTEQPRVPKRGEGPDRSRRGEEGAHRPVQYHRRRQGRDGLPPSF